MSSRRPGSSSGTDSRSRRRLGHRPWLARIDEKQAQGPPAGRLDELDHLLDVRVGRAVAPPAGAGVWPRRGSPTARGRRGADVEAAPVVVLAEAPLGRHAVEGPAERQGGRGQDHRPVAEELVAEHARPTDSGATRRVEESGRWPRRARPPRPGRPPTRRRRHRASLGGVVDVVEDGERRLLRPPLEGRHYRRFLEPGAVMRVKPASRTSEGGHPRGTGGGHRRAQGGRPAGGAEVLGRLLEAVGEGLFDEGGRRGGRTARPTLASGSSSVTTEVTRSTSWWASSTTTTSYARRCPAPRRRRAARTRARSARR